jgi:nickel/cobalt exporter
MFNLLTGTLLLSLLHALIPNHWAPVLAVARSEGWSARRAVGVTVVAGLAHVLSTLVVGVLLGALGWRLSEQYSQIAEFLAPTLLVCIGLIYALTGRHHAHTHTDPGPAVLGAERSQPRARLVLGLAATMFLAPCLEIQTFFLAAGAHSPTAIGMVAGVYLVVTIAGMAGLVAMAYHGLQHMKLGRLARHERLLTGAVLVFVGVAGFFFDW